MVHDAGQCVGGGACYGYGLMMAQDGPLCLFVTVNNKLLMAMSIGNGSYGEVRRI